MEPVFALDIGTRTVVGLLAVPAEGGRMEVLDAEVVEHADRAMRDGQVHDIPEVGRRVRIVAERLGARNGLRLARASVAAAGRALRTVEAHAELAVPRPGEVTESLLRDLAIAAVADAVDRLNSDRSAEISGRGGAFHCVGFSVVRYRLDGEPIDNPLGQRAERLEADLIATFLPRVVTDGLLGALRRADLEVAGLTLEPIAAANAAIPPTMRALNLALVDVGAGTSDIAVTREGAVTGYAMVPMAGDALTEAIASAFLLDFPEAERVKIAFGDAWRAAGLTGGTSSGRAAFAAEDVLGQTVEIPAADLQAAIAPVLEDLARRIAREILALNGKTPAAVLCIGGGSMSPGLTGAIAQALGLPDNRVGMRGADMVKAVDLHRTGDRPDLDALLRGPAGVTPLGIAWGALFRPGFRFRDAWVRVAGPLDPDLEAAIGHLLDERRVQVLDLGRATVFDALVAAGIPARDLAGRPGLGMAIRLGGALKLVPGKAGRPAEVKVDGQPAPLDAPLPEGGRIVVRLATPGEAACATVADVADLTPFGVTINGTPVQVTPVPIVDGKPVSADTPLHDGAEVELRVDLASILPQAGVGPLEREVISYRLDGTPQEIPIRTWELSIGGLPAFPDTPVRPGDEIRAVRVDHPAPRVSDIVPHDHPHDTVRLWLNGSPMEVPIAGFRVLRNGIEVPGECIVADGDDFRVELGAPPIVADLLGLIQSELVGGSGPGKHLRLQVDGAPAQFTTPLRDGARIDARWVEIQSGYGLS